MHEVAGTCHAQLRKTRVHLKSRAASRFHKQASPLLHSSLTLRPSASVAHGLSIFLSRARGIVSFPRRHQRPSSSLSSREGLHHLHPAQDKMPSPDLVSRNYVVQFRYKATAIRSIFVYFQPSLPSICMLATLASPMLQNCKSQLSSSDLAPPSPCSTYVARHAITNMKHSPSPNELAKGL